MLTLTASVVVQLSVVQSPSVMVVGLAPKESILGESGRGTTVTYAPSVSVEGSAPIRPKTDRV